MNGPDELKLYFDYKSPFAYLASAPAFELPQRYAVELRWIPFLLRIKGPGQRSVYSDWKAQYSYMDARRWANKRGGFLIKGPLKIYDSTAALIGGLFAQHAGFFRPYSEQVFARFFRRELEIDQQEAVAALIAELGHSPDEYTAYASGPGPAALERCIEEGHADHIFGVPIFVFRGERFWGHDRIGLLEERLSDAGLCR
jgi:2-hydroxychromene-2-carboxylate isomerase